MGSCTNYSVMQRFVEKYGDEKIEKFKYLIGESIIALNHVEADYWISGEIGLSNNEVFDVHFCWASCEGEDYNNELIKGFQEEFDSLKNKTITEVEIGYDRDDMVYIYLMVDGFSFEVPLIGVDDIDCDENESSLDEEEKTTEQEEVEAKIQNGKNMDVLESLLDYLTESFKDADKGDIEVVGREALKWAIDRLYVDLDMGGEL